ncbi:MAG: 1-acyl-sn-glycerol-3-phosphate acyltransferase [Micromonosporaceae bacterium]|nr:1-acyl-sn-glycerol-3-phosphate acyltransferase [Micromonosporaceae bacterium]
MAAGRLGFWRRFAVAVVKPPLLLLTRRRWHGAEHIPATGGVIVVANHVSHADPLAVAHFVYDAGRWPQFLGKQSVFDLPVVGWLLHRVRQIPVRRGTVDAARSLEAATAAVRAGDAVVIYPEGTITKHPDLWPMRGRTGVARLWLDTGAPVVPVVSWGAQAISDPRTGKLRPRPRTPVTVVAGPPIDLSAHRGSPPTTATMHAITEAVMDRLRELLAEVRREPAPPLWTPQGPQPAPGGPPEDGSG